MIICQKCKSQSPKGNWDHGKYCDSCFVEFEAIKWLEEELKKFRKNNAGYSSVNAFIHYLKYN